MAADGGRLNSKGTRSVKFTEREPHWGHLRTPNRHALGTGPKGMGCVCVGCWPRACITAMVLAADEPLCYECASRGRQ